MMEADPHAEMIPVTEIEKQSKKCKRKSLQENAYESKVEGKNRLFDADP